MPWKSFRSEVGEIEKLRWFQWEFLRRNPEYQSDYDQLAKGFGKWFTSLVAVETGTCALDITGV